MTRTEGGDICLARPSSGRRVVAVVCWGIAAALAYAWQSVDAGGRGRWALVLFGASILIAIWTTWAREEWIARRGQLRHRLRFGPLQRQRVFENAALAITHTVSSEDEFTYRLVVRTPRESRTFDSSVAGEAPLVATGRWLASVTDFPFSRAG